MNPIKAFAIRNKAVLIAIGAFFLPIIFIEIPVLRFTNGVFSYPIDDTCIHLTIAKNIATYGTWGITPHEFVSAASSLLYPLILAGVVKIFGAHLIIPFIVNVIAAIAVLIVIQKWLAREQVTPNAQTWILIAVVYLTPLPSLAMCGMEHIFHMLFTFLFIINFSQELSKNLKAGGNVWKFPWTIYAYGVLMVMSRYEGAPIVAIACLILFIHRKYFLAVKLGLISALPILLFGVYSVYHGNYFVPNSVLLKSGAPPLTMEGLTAFFTDAIFTKLFFSVVGYNTVATQRLLFMLPIAFLLFRKPIQENNAYKYTLLILMSAVFIHLCLTGYAGFPRYEAYIIGCGVVVMGMLVAKYGKELFVGKLSINLCLTWLMAVFLVFPMILRCTISFDKTSKGCIAFYELQYQMGHFLQDHYYNVPIALGDIGAMSYYTVGKKMDLVGLGDIDVARSRKDHYNTTEFAVWLTKKDSIKIAIVADYYTDPQLRKKWVKISTWQTPEEYQGNVFSWYAVDSSLAPQLKQQLLEFQKTLPEGEIVTNY